MSSKRPDPFDRPANALAQDDEESDRDFDPDLRGETRPLDLIDCFGRAKAVLGALVGNMAPGDSLVVIFPPDLPATGPLLSQMLLPAALLTLAVGAGGVLGARSLPRLAAYAAIASMGTAFTAIAGFGPQAIGAALYYMVHSTLPAAFLFLLADVLASRGAVWLDGDLASKGQRLPGLAAALFLAAAVACAGLPPLSGFIGKLFVLQATAPDAAWVWPVVLGGSFLMILGFARAGSNLFWKATGPAPARPLGLNELAIQGLFLVALAHYWHVMDAGRDSVDLLAKRLDRFGHRLRYVLVRNQLRGDDFGLLERSGQLERALGFGAKLVDIKHLHDGLMQKIDAANSNFWAAKNAAEGGGKLGLMERQRLKLWLAHAYAGLDAAGV